MKKKKMALVGLNFGKWLANNELINGAASPYFDLALVCDMDEQLAKACAAEYGIDYCTDIADIIADDTIDIVVLMTGPNGRARLMDGLIDANKAVMTTKPFETDADEALRILEKAREKSVPLFMNSPQPVPPADIACILEWQEKHQLGRLVGYHAHNWANYREKPNGTWYDDPALCPAAPLLRLGIYCLDDLGWFIPDAGETVCVEQSRIFTGRPTADNACVLIRHGDGTIGTIYSSFCVHDGLPYPRALSLQFENGVVTRTTHHDKRAGDLVTVSLSALQKSLEETQSFRMKGRGYRWDLMYDMLEGLPLPANSTTPQQVVKGVRLLEKIKTASGTVVP